MYQYQKTDKKTFLYDLEQIDKKYIDIDKKQILKAVQILIGASQQRLFYIFRDYQNAFDLIQTQQVQYDYLHEVIQIKDEVKFFIDFDFKMQQDKSVQWNTKIADAALQSIIVLFCKIFLFMEEGIFVNQLICKIGNNNVNLSKDDKYNNENNIKRSSFCIDQKQKTSKDYQENKRKLMEAFPIQFILDMYITNSKEPDSQRERLVAKRVKFLQEMLQNITILHSNTNCDFTRKISYHVLFNTVIFQNTEHLNQFVQSIIASYEVYLLNATDEQLKIHSMKRKMFKYLDKSMYFSSAKEDQWMKTLRLYGCNKEAINQQDNRIEFYPSFKIKFHKDLCLETCNNIYDKSIVYITVIKQVPDVQNFYIQFMNRDFIEDNQKQISQVQNEFITLVKDKFNFEINLNKFKYYLFQLHKLNSKFVIETPTWFNFGKILFKEAKYAAKEFETDEQYKINVEEIGQKIRTGQYIHFNNTDQQITQGMVMEQYMNLFDEWSQLAGNDYGGFQCIQDTWTKFQKMPLSNSGIQAILYYYKFELQKRYEEKIVTEKIKTDYCEWKQKVMFENTHSLLLDSFIDLDFKNENDLEEVDIVRISEKKLDLDIFEQTDFGNEKYKIIGIQSQKSTGKSTTFIKYFENILQREPNANVVVITSKVTLASKLCADLSSLNFIKYDDVKDKLDQKRIVVQINSLHRLSSNVIPDYIIVDEIKDLCTYITSDHFNQNTITQNSYFTFQAIVQGCKQMYIFDADLDTSVIVFLKKVIQQQNEYQEKNDKEKGQLLNYKPSNLKMQILLNEFKTYEQEGYKFLYTDIKQWLQMIYVDIYQGKKIVIASLSQVQSVIITEQIEQLFPGVKIIVFNSATDKIYKTIQTSNVNKYWQEYQVIVYSPTITTGISFDTKDVFYRIYMYLCDESTGVLQIFQMAHRIREPLKREIIYTYDLYKSQFPKVDFSNQFVLNKQMEYKIFDSKDDSLKQLRGQSYMIYERVEDKQNRVQMTQKSAYYQLCRNNLKEQLFNKHYILPLCIAYAKKCGYETGKYLISDDEEGDKYRELLDSQLENAKQFFGYSMEKRKEIKIRNATNMKLSLLLTRDQLQQLDNISQNDEKNFDYIKKLLNNEEAQSIFFQMKFKDLEIKANNALPGLTIIKNVEIEDNYGQQMIENYKTVQQVKFPNSRIYDFNELELTDDNKQNIFNLYQIIKENTDKISLMNKKYKLFDKYKIIEKESAFDSKLKDAQEKYLKSLKMYDNQKKYKLFMDFNVLLANNPKLNLQFYMDYMEEEIAIQYDMFIIFSQGKDNDSILKAFKQEQQNTDSYGIKQINRKHKEDQFYVLNKNRNNQMCIEFILQILQQVGLQPHKLQRKQRANMSIIEEQNIILENYDKKQIQHFIQMNLSEMISVFSISVAFNSNDKQNEQLVIQIIDKIFNRFFGIRIHVSDGCLIFENKWINFRYLYGQQK